MSLSSIGSVPFASGWMPKSRENRMERLERLEKSMKDRLDRLSVK